MSDILKKLENLDTLGVDEVEALSLEIREEYEIVRESEFIDLDYAKTLTEALETVGARQAELALEVEAAAAELAALDAVMGFGAEDGSDDADEAGDEEASGDEVKAEDESEEVKAQDEAVEEGEKVEAAAQASVSPRIIKMPGLKQKTPVALPEAQASAKELIIDSDGNARTKEDFAQMFNKAISQLPKNKSDNQTRRTAATLLLDEAIVPKVGRFANFAESNEVFEKIKEQRNQEISEFATLKASGGPCVARRQEFGLDVIGGNCEPVANALPTVQSEAKGTSFYKTLEAFGTGVLTGVSNVYTAAQDLSGAAYPKGCAELDCPTPTDCDKEIIEQCIEIGNWVGLAWPEYVAAVQFAADAHLARTAEENRLSKIWLEANANNNYFNETVQPTSMADQLLDVILRYVQADRSGSRDCSNARYNVFLREDMQAQLQIDVARQLNTAGERLDIDSAVFEILRRYNIAVNFYNAKDQFGVPTGAVGASAAPLVGSGPALPVWSPATRIAIMRDDAAYIEKGPELNLGVFRTQEDFETNNYHMFMEYFEATCFRNNHLFVVDTLVCPNGTQVGTVAAPTC